MENWFLNKITSIVQQLRKHQLMVSRTLLFYIQAKKCHWNGIVMALFSFLPSCKLEETWMQHGFLLKCDLILPFSDSLIWIWMMTRGWGTPSSNVPFEKYLDYSRFSDSCNAPAELVAINASSANTAPTRTSFWGTFELDIFHLFSLQLIKTDPY